MSTSVRPKMSFQEVEQTADIRRSRVGEYLLRRKNRASTSEVLAGLAADDDFRQYCSSLNRSTLLNDLNELRRQGKITLTKGEKSYYWRANV